MSLTRTCQNESQEIQKLCLELSRPEYVPAQLVRNYHRPQIHAPMRSYSDGMSTSPGPSTLPILTSFWHLLEGNRKSYILSILATCLIAAAEGVLHPLLTKSIIDQAANQGSFSTFLYLIAAYLSLGVILCICGYFISIWQLSIDNRIIQTLTSDMLRAFYNHSYLEVGMHGNGYYVSRIRSDVKDGVVPFLSLVRAVSMSVTTFIALMSVLFYISWEAFLILAAIIPVSAGVSLLVGKLIRQLTSVERDQEAAYLSSLSSAIGAFKIVRSFNLIPKALRKHDQSMHQLLHSGYNKFKMIRRLQSLTDLTMVVSDACSLFIGAIFVFKRQMSFGGYIAFMNAFWRSTTALMQVFTQWADLHSYGEIVNRVVAFRQEYPSPPSRRNLPELEISSIYFSYGDNDVLKGFSLKVGATDKIMVRGRNGTGKTTLANIIAGHLHPSSGKIEGPNSMSSMTLPLSFPSLTVGELGIDPELLDRLHIGSEHCLSCKADELSAGQMQKLALALTLSRDRDIYLLDEPFSNLDEESEEIAMDLILAKTADRMLVVIVHGGDKYEHHFDRIVTLGARVGSSPPIQRPGLTSEVG